MKKKKLKFAVKKAMKLYYAKGLYMTAYNVRKILLQQIDKAYKK